MWCQGCVTHNFYMYPRSVTHPIFPGDVWAHNETSAVVTVDTATLQLRETRNKIHEGWSLASAATATETAISPMQKQNQDNSYMYQLIVLITWVKASHVTSATLSSPVVSLISCHRAVSSLKGSWDGKGSNRAANSISLGVWHCSMRYSNRPNACTHIT